MANPEHVEIAKQGTAAIRDWRERTHSEQLDLTEAELTSVDLSGADLRGANFRHAVLRRAYLRRADLQGAILHNADFTMANLRRVNLQGAYLGGAHLSGADLSGANLNGADLSWAHCDRTVFGDVDLSTVTGLDTVVHHGPSIVGVDTLARSQRRIPSAFLQGCGLSDWEIAAVELYDRELSPNRIIDIQQRVFELRAGAPIQIGSLFISYTHSDGAFVDALAEKLKQNGIRFWRDTHSATAGPLDEIIDRAMRLNPTVILVLSKQSVESDWVEDEANRARVIEKQLDRYVLCPVALDDAWKDCNWSRKLRTQIAKYHILPFNNWHDTSAFDAMCRRLLEGLSIFYQGKEVPR